MAVSRTLKLFNGRSWSCFKLDDPNWVGMRQGHDGYIFTAAYSRADLRRLITEYVGKDPGDKELKDYWSQGVWGFGMEGIEPERGIWLKNDKYGNQPPVRLI